MYYLKVALPVYIFDSFYYKSTVPVLAGCRVSVNFHNRHLFGVVLSLCTTPPEDFPEKSIKQVENILDRIPYWNQQTLQLITFAASYQHMPIGEIIEIAQPVALRKGASSEPKPVKGYQLTDPSYAPRNEQQSKILQYLKDQPISNQELRGLNLSQSALRTLIKRQVITEFDMNSLKKDIFHNLLFTNKYTLNQEQTAAYNAIAGSIGKFQVFLLQGVTGSGKTEVYMQTIEQVLLKGQQVLVMVPEIGLTPQTIDRFHRHFNIPIAAMHSGLTDRERLDNYIACRDGNIGILIGTRSSVFTPFKNLGMIIVDEEHDQSYKQQDTCRYNGKNLAIYKAKLAGCPVVLGSATPSMESLYNALTGKYQRLVLSNRACKNSGSITTEIIDIQNTPLQAGISPRLLDSISQELQKGNQVIIFLNRRGYANQVICQNCGYVLQCENCDSFLTYHKSKHILNCHHCESSWALPDACPKCGAQSLTIEGNGTEQIEEFLHQALPDYPILRFDRDTITKPGDMQNHLEGILSGNYKIIIGTQIIAKGHHFPNVTLIALINIDSALFSNDFRSTEQLAQLYTQVAGRTGREEKPGKVILQSYVPNQAVLQTIVAEGYDTFAKYCLEERKYLDLPPYSFQALVRVENTDKARVYQFAEELYRCATGITRGDPEIGISLPYQAMMERKQNKYHVLIMIQSPSRVKISHLLDQIQELITSKRLNTFGVSYYIDVDPTEVLQ